MTPRTKPAGESQATTLPKDGMSRLTQLLPFKLSPTVTVWRNSDIHAWLQAQGEA